VTALLKFRPPVIGHRGASAYAPENTMASFTKAAQLGVKWIEFDVMLSSDDEPIIFHDELLDRTTNGCHEVDRFCSAYLRTLDAGAWFDARFSGERIPSLQQVLEFIDNTRLSVNIELKPLPGQERKLALRILKEMKSYLVQAKTTILFSSFSVEALQTLREHAPDCLMGLLLHEWEPDWQALSISLQCVSVHVNHEIMTREAAHKIKALQKALLCYTVNQPLRALELYSWGVDAVFSDAPDKIMRVL